MGKRKYATAEEARAGRRAGALKAAAARRKISNEQVAQLLADYAERDPTGRRRYRYTGKELAIRYGISALHVWDLAERAGLQRYNANRRIRAKATTEPLREAA